MESGGIPTPKILTCEMISLNCGILIKVPISKSRFIQFSNKKSYHHSNQIREKVSVPGNKIQEFVVLSLLLIFVGKADQDQKAYTGNDRQQDTYACCRPLPAVLP